MIIGNTHKNKFKFEGLILPNTLTCSSTFNKIFKDGYGTDEMEKYLKSRAESTQNMLVDNAYSSVQYNLSSNIWGTKEGVMLTLFDSGDFDFMVTHGCKDGKEWDRMIKYLADLSGLKLIVNEPNNFVYLHEDVLEEENLLILYTGVRESSSSIKFSVGFKG